MHAAAVTTRSCAQSQRLHQMGPRSLHGSKASAALAFTSCKPSCASINRHLRSRGMLRAAVKSECDTSADINSRADQLHGAEVAPEQQQLLQQQDQELVLQPRSQELHTAHQQAATGLPERLLAKLGPLQPAAKAVWNVINAVEPRFRGLILLNIMTFVMGTNWVVLKESNDTFDPVVFTSLRFTLAAAAFAPFLMKGLKMPSVRKAGLEIGTWTALGYLAQSWALSMTAASRASLLSTFTVLAVPCLAGLSGQKVKPLVYGCGIAALVGTALLEQGGGDPANAGDVLSIVSALFFAMQLFRTEQVSRQLPEGNSLPLMAVIISTVAAASISGAVLVHWQDAAAAAGNLWHVVASVLHALGPGDSGADTAQPLYELLYTSFCSTDLVLLIELMALQDVSSTEAALIYSLEPVSGALMAYAFLGERWGAMGWVGAAIILAASITTQLGGAVDDNNSGNKDKQKEAEATS